MLGTGRKAKLDDVRLAMERVRSGESAFEQIVLPSGGNVTIHRDESAPIGVRIQTPLVPGVRRKKTRDDVRRKRMLRRARTASGRIGPEPFEGKAIIPGEEDTIILDPDHDLPREAVAAPGFSGQSFRVRSFPPTENRPPKYPPDLPFLRNLAVSISVSRFEDGSERARNAAWINPSDPKNAMEEIRGQLREGGWDEGETAHAATFMGQTRSWSFKRFGVRRAVVLMDFGKVTQIMLFEREDV